MARKASTLQRLPLSPIIGAMFGAAAAILVAATPDWLLAQAIGASGLAIRLVAMVAVLAVVGGLVWALVNAAERLVATPAAAPKFDERDPAVVEAPSPVVTEARRPISAIELGAPLMSDEALRSIEPLAEASVEVDIIEDVPAAVEAIVVPDTAPVIEVGEPAQPVPTESTIEALIARLEAGLARHGPPTPPKPTGQPAQSAASGTGSSWIVREDDAGKDPSAALRRAFAG